MKSNVCTICLEPLFKDIQVSHCGHCFHRPCIFRWIDRSPSCPNCKQHLDASELTRLILDPVEMVREVMNDPTVLESVDPELVVKMLGGGCKGKDSGDSSSDVGDDEIDSEILNLNQQKSGDKKWKNPKLQLIQQRMQSTALRTQNDELQKQMEVLHTRHRSMEDGQTALNQKLQSYLQRAQDNELKFLKSSKECGRLTREVYKRNKEINECREEIDTLMRRQSVLEHCELIKIGNFAAAQQSEERAHSSKSPAEQAKYFRSMYDWILGEYKKSKADREKDKASHQSQQKQWSIIHEEQRLKIDEYEQLMQANNEKKERYKTYYFKMKEKYTRVREAYKTLLIKNKELMTKMEQTQYQRERRLDTEFGRLSVEPPEEEEEEGDDNDLQVYSDQENIENIEPPSRNHPRTQADAVEDDEDDDLCVLPEAEPRHREDRNIFTANQNSHNHSRQMCNSLFGAYRELNTKLQTKTTRNPFAQQSSSASNRKRSFAQISKGDDGRGGTSTFLTENTAFHNNNANNPRKRRRTVKSTSASSSNHTLHQFNKKKANQDSNNVKIDISKYFTKSKHD